MRAGRVEPNGTSADAPAGTGPGGKPRDQASSTSWACAPLAGERWGRRTCSHSQEASWTTAGATYPLRPEALRSATGQVTAAFVRQMADCGLRQQRTVRLSRVQTTKLTTAGSLSDAAVAVAVAAAAAGDNEHDADGDAESDGPAVGVGAVELCAFERAAAAVAGDVAVNSDFDDEAVVVDVLVAAAHVAAVAAPASVAAEIATLGWDRKRERYSCVEWATLG